MKSRFIASIIFFLILALLLIPLFAKKQEAIVCGIDKDTDTLVVILERSEREYTSSLADPSTLSWWGDSSHTPWPPKPIKKKDKHEQYYAGFPNSWFPDSTRFRHLPQTDLSDSNQVLIEQAIEYLDYLQGWVWDEDWRTKHEDEHEPSDFSKHPFRVRMLLGELYYIKLCLRRLDEFETPKYIIRTGK